MNFCILRLRKLSKYKSTKQYTIILFCLAQFTRGTWVHVLLDEDTIDTKEHTSNKF